MNDIDYHVQIKACPFCGSFDILIDKCTSRARCKNCYATGGLIGKLLKDGVKKEDAPIRAWNTRAYEETN